MKKRVERPLISKLRCVHKTTKMHKDKSKYTRKSKHKNED